MSVIIIRDPRAPVDFSDPIDLQTLVFASTPYFSDPMAFVAVLPTVPNPSYDPAQPGDSFFGSPSLTLWWQLSGSFTYLPDGVPDFATSEITGFALGFWESGEVYDISDFTLAGADFATYLIANDGIGLAAAIEGPAADAYFYGTGSTLIGGSGGAAVHYPGVATDYTIGVTLADASATVLANGGVDPDVLGNLAAVQFTDTILRPDAKGINVAATGRTGTTVLPLSPGNVLAVPTALGSVALHLNPVFSYAGYSFVAMPDGGGGTRVMQSGADPAYSVMAADGEGGVRGITIALTDGPARISAMQALLDPVNAGVIGRSIAVGTAPLSQGAAGELLVTTSGGYVMGPGYTTAVVDAFPRATVSGGAADGQLVIASNYGIAFNAGAGAGSVFAGTFPSLVSTYPGAGNQYVDLGGGDDIVIALGGNDTIRAGTGNNQILLGAGSVSVVSAGWDLIAGGSGSATIATGTNLPTIFLGSGTSLVQGGPGFPTIVGTTGADTIATQGRSMVWLGANTDVVNSAGSADTIVGGLGSATVSAIAGSPLIFAGPGALDFTGGAGAATILGSAAGSQTLTGGGGGMLALSYGQMLARSGAGADTVAAFAGSVTIIGSGAAGLFLGGPAGHNVISAGSTGAMVPGQATIFGGGDGDVLTAGSTLGDYILAGAGAETISGITPQPRGPGSADHFYGGTGANLFLCGAATTAIQLGSGTATIVGSQTGLGLFAFLAGRAAQVTISGFNPTLDYLSLQAFPAGEAAAALAGASFSGGSETLALSDGTHITFSGFTALTSNHFL
ncbi:MAG: hypothetical protein NT133_15900 [Alphaproteobacteria bacterium]|nr:hypothetical protein [Alphaproteobacteria bacterium]